MDPKFKGFCYKDTHKKAPPFTEKGRFRLQYAATALESRQGTPMHALQAPRKTFGETILEQTVYTALTAPVSIYPILHMMRSAGFAPQKYLHQFFKGLYSTTQ